VELFLFPRPQEKSPVKTGPFEACFGNNCRDEEGGRIQTSNPQMTRMDADKKAIGMILKMVARGFYLRTSATSVDDWAIA
jgi:hypothetical protein